PMLNAAPPDLHALAVNVVPRGQAVQGVTVTGLYANLGGGGGNFGQAPNMASQPAAKVPAGGRLAVAKPGEQKGGSRDQLREAAQDLRHQAQLTANIKKEKDASELANYAAVLEQACEWTMDAQKKTGGERRANKNEGPSVTYHLAARLSVPSRNDE